MIEYAEDGRSRQNAMIREFGRPPESIINQGEESVHRWFVGRIEERNVGSEDYRDPRYKNAQVRADYLRRMVQLLSKEK